MSIYFKLSTPRRRKGGGGRSHLSGADLAFQPDETERLNRDILGMNLHEKTIQTLKTPICYISGQSLPHSTAASGPAFLILLCLLLKKFAGFDPKKEAVDSLSKIVTYGLRANVFFLICEVFVVFYSQIPEHMDHFIYLYAGLHGKGGLVSWMWLSVILMGGAMVLLLIPTTRRNEKILAVSCALVFSGTWIDKGVGLISGGFFIKARIDRSGQPF